MISSDPLSFDVKTTAYEMPNCLELNLANLESVMGHLSFPLVIVALCGTIANGLLVFVVCRLIHRRRLSYKRFYLTLNTCIMDCISAATITVISAIHINKRLSSNTTFMDDTVIEIAQLATTIVVMAPAAYYLSQCIVQYIAVLHPIFYAIRVTKPVIFGMIAFQWLCLMFTMSIALAKFLSSGNDTAHSPIVYYYTAIAYEYYRIAFVALFALAIIGVYGTVLVQVLVYKRQTEGTLKSFIKSFGFNISLYLCISAAMLILSSLQFSPYHHYLRMTVKLSAPAYYNRTLIGDGSDEVPIRETMTQVCTVLRIKWYEAIVNVLWLSRLLLDPILHFTRHAIFRRSMSCVLASSRAGSRKFKQGECRTRIVAATAANAAKTSQNRTEPNRTEPKSADHKHALIVTSC